MRGRGDTLRAPVAHPSREHTADRWEPIRTQACPGSLFPSSANGSCAAQFRRARSSRPVRSPRSWASAFFRSRKRCCVLNSKGWSSHGRVPVRASAFRARDEVAGQPVVRAAPEAHAAGLFTRTASPAVREAVRGVADRLDATCTYTAAEAYASMDRELHITLAAATGFEPLRAPIDQAHALPMARMSAVCGANPTGRRADRLARCDALCGLIQSRPRGRCVNRFSGISGTRWRSSLLALVWSRSPHVAVATHAPPLKWPPEPAEGRTRNRSP